MQNTAKDPAILESAAALSSWSLTLDCLVGTKGAHLVLGMAAGYYQNSLMAAVSCQELLAAPIPQGLNEAQVKSWRQLLWRAEARAEEGKAFLVLACRQPVRQGGAWRQVWRDFSDGLLLGWAAPEPAPGVALGEDPF